jgi:hypothetical protein
MIFKKKNQIGVQADRGLGGEQIALAPLFAAAMAEHLNNAKGSLRLAADDSVAYVPFSTGDQ